MGRMGGTMIQYEKRINLIVCHGVGDWYYKDGKISTHGWTQQTDKDPFSYGKKIAKLGAGYILFSSVEADGAFIGPDFKNIKKMVESVKIPIYAAGGVRNEEDIKNLKKIGVWGIIVGKAFYENKLPISIIKNTKYYD